MLCYKFVFEVFSLIGWGTSIGYVVLFFLVFLVSLQQIVFVGLTCGCGTLNPDDLIDYLIMVTSVLFSSKAFYDMPGTLYLL